MNSEALKGNIFPRMVHLFTLSRTQSKSAQGQSLGIVGFWWDSYWKSKVKTSYKQTNKEKSELLFSSVSDIFSKHEQIIGDSVRLFLSP